MAGCEDKGNSYLSKKKNKKIMIIPKLLLDLKFSKFISKSKGMID